MNSPESLALISALRSRVDAIETSPEAKNELSPALARSVEKTLFLRGGIGPVSSILRRACDALEALEDWRSLGDPELLHTWFDCVEKEAMSFSRAPAGWKDSASAEFCRRCSIVFGIDDSHIHTLLLNFHTMPREERMAIFLPIRRSELFKYIDREINEMTEDVEISDPDDSFRSLIRSVSATA